MSADTLITFKLLNGEQISARSVAAARLTASQKHTKLIGDANKRELDQYQHRFGRFVR